MSSFPFKHICVIGTSGSGKTTFARVLAEKIGGDHIELDALYHGPNWSEPTEEEFTARIRNAMKSERWIIDGNYISRASQLQYADLIVWLDYSFVRVLSRIARRTLKRLITNEELWNGNKESWRLALTKNGMIYWVLHTYSRRRREFPVMLSSKYSHIAQQRFQRPRDADEWLRSIS